jgi:hypothetical protein
MKPKEPSPGNARKSQFKQMLQILLEETKPDDPIHSLTVKTDKTTYKFFFVPADVDIRAILEKLAQEDDATPGPV